MRVLRPSVDLALVHRLDRETSGCLLLAKRRSALRELHRQLRANAVDKRYIALLAGQLPRQKVVVDAPLRKNTLRSGERVVRVDAAEGKAARTIFRVLGRFADLTLVEAELITGRTHQIRVHAAHLGMPVAGDEKYGDQSVNRRLRQLGLRRLYLHAAALSFALESGTGTIRIEAPLPAELNAVISSLEP
jgi:23S rRNA pseudouridine955/2504/2580 synthase